MINNNIKIKRSHGYTGYTCFPIMFPRTLYPSFPYILILLLLFINIINVTCNQCDPITNKNNTFSGYTTRVTSCNLV